jgi:hypothetical protein
MVTLCGVCDQEVAEEQKARKWERGRFWGVVIGTIALTSAGVLWPVSLAVMIGLAWFRLIGVSLFALLLLSSWVQVSKLPPSQYLTHFVAPWAVIVMAGAGVTVGMKRRVKKQQLLFIEAQRRGT